MLAKHFSFGPNELLEFDHLDLEFWFEILKENLIAEGEVVEK